MTPEERLDGLIERWESGVSPGRVESLEVEACLAAAAALMQLQALVVPPAFAARLEARVRAHARNLAAPQRKVIAFPRTRRQSGRR